MSDYLGNLIARTVSPATAVRPQLPSLFEPAPATRETMSGPELEQQSFVEQPPVTQPSEKLAPMPLSIPTPGQSVFREPEQTVPETSPAKKNLEPSKESEPAVQPRIFRRATPTLREDKPSNSTRRRSDVIKSLVRDLIASASHEVRPREETPPSQASVGSKAVVVPELREHKLLKRLEVQAIVPTIRSLPPIAPLPPAAATARPTINVTIGRVEIRAVPPPTQQRAKPKPASVLSLEDYLRQRAKGAAQ
jgi:hypothetical protein